MRTSARIVGPGLLAAALLLGACDSTDEGSGASAFPQELAALQSCMTGSVDSLLVTLGGMADLVGDLQNPAGAGTLTPTGDPLVWLFSIGDLSGTATFSTDPTAGFGPGDSVDVFWDYEPASAVIGSGGFTFELTGPATVGFWGTAAFDDEASQCFFNLVIDETLPMQVDFSGVGSLAANIGGADVSGSGDIVASEGESELVARMVLPAGSQNVEFQNASLNGSPVDSFSLALSTAPPGGGSVGAWNGVWALEYDCSGPEGNFLGNATIEIDHAAGAQTFTGVERDGGLSLPFMNVQIVGDEATLFIEYDRGDGRLIREQQTFRLAADGNSFTKTSTARYRDDNSIFVTCTGSAVRQ